MPEPFPTTLPLISSSRCWMFRGKGGLVSKSMVMSSRHLVLFPLSCSKTPSQDAGWSKLAALDQHVRQCAATRRRPVSCKAGGETAHGPQRRPAVELVAAAALVAGAPTQTGRRRLKSLAVRYVQDRPTRRAGKSTSVVARPVRGTHASLRPSQNIRTQETGSVFETSIHAKLKRRTAGSYAEFSQSETKKDA